MRVSMTCDLCVLLTATQGNSESYFVSDCHYQMQLTEGIVGFSPAAQGECYSNLSSRFISLRKHGSAQRWFCPDGV